MLYKEPFLIFAARQENKIRQSESSYKRETLRSQVIHLLSTERGSAVSLPHYGLPSGDPEDPKAFMDVIKQAIQDSIPYLERHNGNLSISVDETNSINRAIFTIKFTKPNEDFSLRLSFLKTRWRISWGGSKT